MDGQSLLLNGSMVYPISEPSSWVRRKHWCRMQALVSRCAPKPPPAARAHTKPRQRSQMRKSRSPKDMCVIAREQSAIADATVKTDGWL